VNPDKLSFDIQTAPGIFSTWTLSTTQLSQYAKNAKKKRTVEQHATATAANRLID